MKQFCYLPFICLLILCAIPLTISAQEVHDGSEFTTTDYKNLVLPPLDLLFENAKKGPIYEAAYVKEQIERKILAKEKRAFLSFFSLRGSYQYGMFGNCHCTLSYLHDPGTKRIYHRRRCKHSVGRAFRSGLSHQTAEADLAKCRVGKGNKV